MDELRHLAAVQGFFTRLDALDFGYLDRHLTAGVRGRELVRFRRGYYSFADDWRLLDAAGTHLLRADAVAHSLGGVVAESHVTSALRQGMSTYGVSLAKVHVTRLDGAQGRIEPDLVHHEGHFRAEDLVQVDGRLVTAPDRAAVETGILATSEGALVTADSFLRLGLGSHDDLMRRFLAMGNWPRARHLHVPVRMADGGAESVGESRGRWLFWKQGIPTPVVQYPVHDYDGSLIGTCDWAWPELGLLGEFDGRIKYGRLLRPGQDPGEVVFAEKQREDRMRQVTDYLMVRLIWSDYDRPRVTGGRVRGKFRRVS